MFRVWYEERCMIHVGPRPMKLSRTSSPFLTLSPIFAACELERRIDMNPFDIPRKGASSNASGKGETTFAVCIEFAPVTCMSKGLISIRPSGQSMVLRTRICTASQ